MGQNSSTEQPEKPTRAGSRGGTPRPGKKVEKKPSVHKLPGRGPTAANPSLSTTSATAQPISQPQGTRNVLHHAVHSNTASPDSLSKASSVERTTSRSSPLAPRQHELEYRPSPSQPIPAASPSVPMDVPASRSRQSDYMQNADSPRTYAPVSALRPPRLPLPIADAEMDIPDSPTLPQAISNADVSAFDSEESPLIETNIQRQHSMLSDDTPEDEDMGDELRPYATQVTSQMVPTVISWNHPGSSKVYVTGTFANWEKKFRLHPSESHRGMSATIPLPPGTHHLKFIVDGDMMINPDLPTAVDYTNVLVNYLEVNADEIPAPRTTRRESDRSKPYPAHPPLAPPPDDDDSGTETEMDREPTEEEIPIGDYRQIFPQALIDMELPDEDPKYQTAASIIEDCPGPPSMPMFLGKSVLNGQLPLKDDSSVLPLPNHTVLNHLATSSLKNGVLATSVTTRYKQKYVTTIMYRPVRPPTHGEGE